MTRSFQIRKKSNLPPKGARRSKYPWHEIKTGRPLFIQVPKVQDVSSTAYSAAKRMGVKFTLRKVDGGVEIHLA